MKKIFLLLSLVFISSCSVDDIYPLTNHDNHVKPPLWLIGNWTDGKGNVFTFTADDMLYNFNGTTYSAYDEIMYYEDTYGSPELNQSGSSYTYHLRYYYSFLKTMDFNFEKISSNKMISTGFMPGTYTRL